MKKAIYLCLLTFMTLSFYNCNKSKTAAKTDQPEVIYSAKQKKKVKKERPTVQYENLAHYLRNKGGIQVTGFDEESTRLKLRGMNSLTGDTRPFIYVDKIPLGRSYKAANNAVDPNDIISVRFLSSLSEVAIYGEDGHSGIILIKTKTGSKRK